MLQKEDQGAELFLVTKKLLTKVEQQVVRIETRYSWLNYILNHSFFPLMFLAFGMTELFRPLKTWGTLFLISSIVILIINIPEDQKSSLLSVCFFGSIILVMYALPSSYAFDSVLSGEIVQIKQFVSQQGVKTEERIKLLINNIDLVKARVYARVNFFKWLLGVSWALSLFIFNQFNSIVIKISPDMIKEIIGESIGSLSVLGIFSLFILCSIISYKKANDAVFCRISLAFNELQYEIESNQRQIDNDKNLGSST